MDRIKNISNGKDLIVFFDEFISKNKTYNASTEELLSFLIDGHDLKPQTHNLIKAIRILSFEAQHWQEGLQEVHAYHNLNHMMYVAVIVTILIAYHQKEIAPINNHVLALDDQLILLLVALVHDVGHPAKGNPKDSPYRNEEITYRFITNTIEENTLPNSVMDDIKILLYATSPAGPYQFLKANNLFKQAGIWGQKPDDYDDPKFEPIIRLTQDRKLCLMASLLNDADLSLGAGLGKVHALNATKAVLQEVGIDAITQDSLHAHHTSFLQRVFGDTGFLSMAGRALMNENYFRLIEKKGDTKKPD